MVVSTRKTEVYIVRNWRKSVQFSLEGMVFSLERNMVRLILKRRWKKQMSGGRSSEEYGEKDKITELNQILTMLKNHVFDLKRTKSLGHDILIREQNCEYCMNFASVAFSVTVFQLIRAFSMHKEDACSIQKDLFLLVHVSITHVNSYVMLLFCLSMLGDVKKATAFHTSWWSGFSYAPLRLWTKSTYALLTNPVLWTAAFMPFHFKYSRPDGTSFRSRCHLDTSLSIHWRAK